MLLLNLGLSFLEEPHEYQGLHKVFLGTSATGREACVNIRGGRFLT